MNCKPRFLHQGVYLGDWINVSKASFYGGHEKGLRETCPELKVQSQALIWSCLRTFWVDSGLLQHNPWPKPHFLYNPHLVVPAIPSRPAYRLVYKGFCHQVRNIYRPTLISRTLISAKSSQKSSQDFGLACLLNASKFRHLMSRGFIMKYFMTQKMHYRKLRWNLQKPMRWSQRVSANLINLKDGLIEPSRNWHKRFAACNTLLDNDITRAHIVNMHQNWNGHCIRIPLTLMDFRNSSALSSTSFLCFLSMSLMLSAHLIFSWMVSNKFSVLPSLQIATRHRHVPVTVNSFSEVRRLKLSSYSNTVKIPWFQLKRTRQANSTREHTKIALMFSADISKVRDVKSQRALINLPGCQCGYHVF